MKYLVFLIFYLGSLYSFSQSLPTVQVNRGYGLLSGEKQILLKSTGFCISHELNKGKVILLGGYIFDQGASRRNYSVPLNTFYLEGIRSNTWYLGAAKRFKLKSESKSSLYFGASLHWRKTLETCVINSVKPGGWVEGWVENKVHPTLGQPFSFFTACHC